MPPQLSNDDLSTAASTGGGTVQTLDRAVEPEVGTVLGQFRIEARIGQGGLGSVFCAYDVKLARPVALKVLHEASSTEAPRRLLAEARAAASLMHASIAAIHDVQQQQGVAFIVMELVPGESLRTEVRRGAIPVDIAVGYLVDIAAGLARAHGAGIVHRDLKPENIMITPDGHAKILDFGLAREAPDGPPPSSKTGSAGAVGTPSYMAPEQARGDRVDARADVFAFGVVAYEMLTGTRPFASSRSRAGDARDWRLASPSRTPRHARRESSWRSSTGASPSTAAIASPTAASCSERSERSAGRSLPRARGSWPSSRPPRSSPRSLTLVRASSMSGRKAPLRP